MGVRLRATLTATAAVAVALGLAAVALFMVLDASLASSTRHAAMAQADQRANRLLVGAGRQIEPVLTFVPVPHLNAGIRIGDSPSAVAEAKTRARLNAAAGTHRGPTGGAAPGAGTASAPNAGAWAGTYSAGHTITAFRIVATKDGPVTVQGSASTEPAREAMHTLVRVLVPGGPALLALVALLTWLAVGRALRPVSAIRAKVAEITAYGLHERVPVPAARDEIASLARTVNATLDRLSVAVDAHRQFVADAAHELRSPMTVLRTRLELAAPEEKRLAREALKDVDRLGALTADLLLLARLDARGPLRLREVDIAQLIAEEAAQRRPRTEVRVELRVRPDVLLNGSPDHLRRMVANLLDNAVRHAASRVRVTLTVEDGRAVLDVQDDGPGIPEGDRAVIFQRFARLDAARARDTGGAGLGLPIARDVAEAHGGSLALVGSLAPVPAGSPTPAESGVGGAHFRVVLPLG
jgi:signal transduction histidine kinase